MSHRRRNNRGSGGRKTNLDDLDGALSGMIQRPGAASSSSTKMVPEERRFTMHDASTQGGSVFAAHLQDNPLDMSGGQATHTSDFEKHQVNYSDTKYIKP